MDLDLNTDAILYPPGPERTPRPVTTNLDLNVSDILARPPTPPAPAPRIRGLDFRGRVATARQKVEDLAGKLPKPDVRRGVKAAWERRPRPVQAVKDRLTERARQRETVPSTTPEACEPAERVRTRLKTWLANQSRKAVRGIADARPAQAVREKGKNLLQRIRTQGPKVIKEVITGAPKYHTYAVAAGTLVGSAAFAFINPELAAEVVQYYPIVRTASGLGALGLAALETTVDRESRFGKVARFARILAQDVLVASCVAPIGSALGEGGRSFWINNVLPHLQPPVEATPITGIPPETPTHTPTSTPTPTHTPTPGPTETPPTTAPELDYPLEPGQPPPGHQQTPVLPDSRYPMEPGQPPAGQQQAPPTTPPSHPIEIPVDQPPHVPPAPTLTPLERAVANLPDQVEITDQVNRVMEATRRWSEPLAKTAELSTGGHEFLTDAAKDIVARQIPQGQMLQPKDVLSLSPEVQKAIGQHLETAIRTTSEKLAALGSKDFKVKVTADDLQKLKDIARLLIGK